MTAQLIFLLITGAAVYLFSRNIGHICSLIRLGKDPSLNIDPSQGWRNVFLLALGQRKMFRNPLVAVMHLIIYAGFIIINLEVLEILLDGLLGQHRIFLAPLNALGLYSFLINSFEILALLVLAVCVIFLARRNILTIARFRSKDLEGWPRSDANLILITEIILMSLFLLMNAADLRLQGLSHPDYHSTGDFIISRHLVPLFQSISSPTLVVLERSFWWLHIIGILAFLNYLPYSKHLHILFAFPNAYYAPQKPAGTMRNMEAVQREVLYMMQPEQAPAESAPPAGFGARDVTDLSWKNLLDAFSCTECGRCSSACPAHQTGKKLSPRKIMMDTRDRLEEVGQSLRKTGSVQPDGKTLLNDYITVEELRACTTCNACVEECPVSISPLDIILELRRSLIMEDSNAPQEWNTMFSNMENNFAPWKFSPDEREAWARES